MSPRSILPLVLAGLGCAAACHEAGPTAEITERRVAAVPSRFVVPGAGAAQRFRAEMGDMGAPGASGSPADSLAYDLPTGWQKLPPTSDRMINLRPGGDPDASCYVTFLPGSASGLEANVNRWLKQFGSAPLNADEVAALPKHPLFGRDATLVEVAGTFGGMSGDAPRPGFKLLGLIISESSGSLFLKFIGPGARVDGERANFFSFASSLRVSEEHGVSDVEPEQSTSSGALTWKAPAGWIEQPPRMMREVSFTVGQGGECYVTRLGAGAGGLRMNLDRWRSQFGLGPLSDEEFTALPQVTAIGTQTPLLELSGNFTGMGDTPVTDQALLGVAVFRAQDSLFVKFTGPAEVVRGERANFLAFLASLEEQS